MIESQILAAIEKNLLDGSLHDLIELTYAYESRGIYNFNVTFFSHFVSLSGDESYDLAYDLFAAKVTGIFSQITFYQDALNLLDLSLKGKIMKKYLAYMHDIFEMILVGLPFELEKSGWSHDLSDEEIGVRVSRLGGLEKKRFGSLVQDNVFEVSRSYALLDDLLQVGGEKYLTQVEYGEYRVYLDILAKHPKYSSVLDYDNGVQGRSMTDNKAFQKKISRDVYVEIFRSALAFYAIDIPVIIDSRSSVYDAEDALYIPANEGYAYMSMQKIIELIFHEVETHYLIQKNNKKLLGSIKGANNLFREEGLATFNEEIIDGTDVSTLDVGIGAAQILMGELLDGDDFVRFIYLYRKLRGEELLADGYVLRRKRNYPLYHVGVPHKDMTYSRGKFMVRGYLMSGGEYRDLYLAKVNFSDMKLLATTLTYREKNDLSYPVFLAERLLCGTLGKKFSPQQFVSYLQEKYTFINFDCYDINLSEKQQDILQSMLSALMC